MTLLTKEHGAYFQMALPIATSFAIAGVSPPALLFALAVIAGFLAHERVEQRRACAGLTDHVDVLPAVLHVHAKEPPLVAERRPADESKSVGARHS